MTITKKLATIFSIILMIGMFSISAFGAENIRIGAFVNGHDFATMEDSDGTNIVYCVYQGKKDVESRIVIDKEGLHLEKLIPGKNSWYWYNETVKVKGKKYDVLTSQKGLVILDKEGYIFLDITDYSHDYIIGDNCLQYKNVFGETIAVDLETFEVSLLKGCDCYAEAYAGAYHYGTYVDNDGNTTVQHYGPFTTNG